MGSKVIALDQERILNDAEKTGLNLDSAKTYALRFLYNDKLNQATDPKPFRINESFTDELAKKVIGMPWITPPTSATSKKEIFGCPPIRSGQTVTVGINSTSTTDVRIIPGSAAYWNVTETYSVAPAIGRTTSFGGSSTDVWCKVYYREYS